MFAACLEAQSLKNRRQIFVKYGIAQGGAAIPSPEIDFHALLIRIGGVGCHHFQAAVQGKAALILKKGDVAGNFTSLGLWLGVELGESYRIGY